MESSAPSVTDLDRPVQPENRQAEQEIQQIIRASLSKKLGRIVLEKKEDRSLLESKGFGTVDVGDDQFYLKDYEALYLIFTKKLVLKSAGKEMSFESLVNYALKKDGTAWTRFLIFRDLRTRGYVVKEGFGFPIDFRVYDRGDFGTKAAKYIVFGLNEGKTMTMGELKTHVEQMVRMGKESVIAVVERRGEVIYYKVGKWRPIKPL